MAEKKVGKYAGEYYGSDFDESEALSNEEMHLNARYIFEVLHHVHGWTLNAIAGMLGNMQAESSINPGRWQGNKVGNKSGGYGLVQWTPASKYLDWCEIEGYAHPEYMDSNIERILYELEEGGQYYKTSNYDLTFEEFVHSEADAGYLAKAFLFNYERPKDKGLHVQNTRASLAKYWFNYLKNYYAKPTVPDKLYRVQVGAFANKNNADRLVRELKAAGYKDAFIKE